MAHLLPSFNPSHRAVDKRAGSGFSGRAWWQAMPRWVRSFVWLRVALGVLIAVELMAVYQVALGSVQDSEKRLQAVGLHSQGVLRCNAVADPDERKACMTLLKD
jgi:hypothetical protein